MIEKAMRVTFLDVPDWVRGEGVDRVLVGDTGALVCPDLFSLTLAAILRKHGIGAGYEDFNARKRSEREFLGWLEKDFSDIYCINSVSSSWEGDLYAVRLIRQVRGGVPVIFTGPGPTMNPRAYIIDARVVVVRGEPERNFEKVVRKVDQGDFKALREIPSVNFRVEDYIFHTDPAPPLADIDDLPFPARNLVRQQDYMNSHLSQRPWTGIFTSRGCSHSCAHCVPGSGSFAREIEFKRSARGRKPPVRLRSLVNIYSELQEIRADGYRSFSVLDDQFIWGEKRTVRFCDMVRPFGMEWGCAVNPRLVTEKIAKAFGRSGCRYVEMRAESFSEEVFTFIERACTPEDVRRAVRLLEDAGVAPKLTVVVGNEPLESESNLKKTMNELLRLGPSLAAFSIASLHPGTDLYEKARADGWLIENNYRTIHVQRPAQVKYSRISLRTLERWLKFATLRFYLSPRFLFRNLVRVISGRPALLRLRDWWGTVTFARKARVGLGLHYGLLCGMPARKD